MKDMVRACSVNTHVKLNMNKAWETDWKAQQPKVCCQQPAHNGCPAHCYSASHLVVAIREIFMGNASNWQLAAAVRARG